MLATQINPWLEQKGSITDKLKQLAGHTKLQVLSHSWETSDAWDSKILKLPENTEVLHRDILMWADNQTCWYARTILPQYVYQAESLLFEQLKSKPLGELIHHHPEIHRTHINSYEIHAHMPEYQYLKHALKQNTPTHSLWGRVSTFTIRNQYDFYLLEILLPGLLRYC
ncbi:MAG: chorismate lyase [Gammaproteobacteria bacterium]|nr:chorismate lyase [Gammaproteobacteria bacterium]MCH9764338.1 chorismate lyase [Gammaproteobacteria bacterium]